MDILGQILYSEIHWKHWNSTLFWKTILTPEVLRSSRDRCVCLTHAIMSVWSLIAHAVAFPWNMSNYLTVVYSNTPVSRQHDIISTYFSNKEWFPLWVILRNKKFSASFRKTKGVVHSLGLACLEWLSNMEITLLGHSWLRQYYFAYKVDLHKLRYASYHCCGNTSQHGKVQKKQMSLCNYCQWGRRGHIL